MVGHPIIMVSSPILQAKKAARDAKRKKLQAMFHKHKESESAATLQTEEESMAFAYPQIAAAGEPSQEATSPPPQHYASYQHAADPELGRPGHVVLLGGGSSQEARGELLREQAQALIHNVDPGITVPSGDAFLGPSSQSLPSVFQARMEGILQTIQANPKTSFNTFLFFLMMYWWL